MSYRSFWLCLCFYLVFGINTPTAWGKVHAIDWTVSGVREYLYSPLQVKLGDMLAFKCMLGSYSNIVYQADERQHIQCNSSLGSVAMFQGSCRGNLVHNVTMSITQSSTNLTSLINYVSGTIIYYASYSNGLSYRSAVLDQQYGGECLQNLKLAVQILSVDSVTTNLPATTSTSFTTTIDVSESTTELPETLLDVLVVGELSGDQSLHYSCSTLLTLITVSVTSLMLRC